MTPTIDLAELLRRVALQDRAAFSLLYDATASKLYGTILRIVKRRDVADDVLQDVYVRIWERAVAFELGKGSPIAWMGAIARNRSFDELRRKTLPMVDPDDVEVENIESGDLHPLAVLEQTEDLRRLSQCLDKLDAERREIVLLAYRDGFSREELGQRFAQPTGTIKTWLRRSLIQLNACLER